MKGFPMPTERPDLYNTFQVLKERHSVPDLEVLPFGVRYMYGTDKDLFKDYLGCEYNGHLYIWHGTTDPGVEATRQKEGGAAHLVLGFHPEIWRVRYHAQSVPTFTHLALCQPGKSPIKIWRDSNRNYKYDHGEPIQSSKVFYINFHRASIHILQHIGPYSYGCIVTQDKRDFDFFMNIVINSNMYKSNHNCDFSFLLLSSKELPI